MAHNRSPQLKLILVYYLGHQPFNLNASTGAIVGQAPAHPSGFNLGCYEIEVSWAVGSVLVFHFYEQII